MLLSWFFHGEVLPQPEEGFGLVLFEGTLQVQIPFLFVAQAVITAIFATVVLSVL